MELLSFIQQSGSVIAALKLVAKGLLATRIAKVKDVAETAILNAMYAKDFVVNLKNSIVALANQAKAFAASLAAKIADKAETLADRKSTRLNSSHPSSSRMPSSA